MRYLIGVDFGGTSSKATLLKEDGTVCATAIHEYPTFYPKSGWAEQDPEDSYRAMVQNIRSLLAQSGIQPEAVAALALDAATHTAVLLDEKDRPVRPAIYWTDNRSTKQAEWLREHHEADIRRICYNSVSSLWTLPQLLWLQENEPETMKATRRLLFMKDYLRLRLTGDFVTDAIDAMGCLLLDAERGEWSPKLCELAGINPSILPPIVTPTETLSGLTAQAQADTGLTGNTRVIAGATDTVLEVYAAGAVRVGQATVKLATAGRICSVTDHPVVDPTLVTYRHVVDGLWYPGTATRSCATSNRWYRDTFGGEFQEMSDAAVSVPRGCDGLFFHPYLQGEITPYLDDKLRASFTGATGFHTKAHFNRAVLEGVAYSMKDCYQTLMTLGIAPKEAVIIGGGAKSPLWRQIMADMLKIPLVMVANVDSSLGSAMLAGVAAGVFAGHQEAVDACVQVTGRVEPNREASEEYDENFGIYKRIQAALAPIYHDL